MIGGWDDGMVEGTSVGGMTGSRDRLQDGVMRWKGVHGLVKCAYHELKAL